MQPLINPGQSVLVSSLPFIFKNPQIGDVVVLKANNKLLIKRISKTSQNRFLVEGDNTGDSKKIDWIEKSQILGKVIYVG